METRANYALIGVFTLAVIASAFAFVMWFSGSGDRSYGQHTYKIVFTGSVTGLLRGAPVLFNGVRVGDVTNLDFEPQDPSHVYALVEIDARVPVRVDTRARLESTGLTGVASIALLGGTEKSPPLAAGPDKGPGVIIAERSDFQDLIESARRISGQASDVLGKVDGLAGETNDVMKAINPDDVRTIVKDVASLAAKLDKAADKVNEVLTSLSGALGPSDGNNGGPLGDIAAAARSIKKAADNLDSRTKEIAANINHFTGTGLRQYEALAVDGRKTLEQINQAVRSIENNPQQFLFGKSPQIPEYSGRR